MLFRLTTLVAFILFCNRIYAPDTSTSLANIQQIPSKYLSTVSSKVSDLENKLDKKAEKALEQMAKQEAKMKSKLQKIDSLAANNIFADADKKDKELDQRLQSNILKQYIRRIDTFSTSLKFLQQNSQILSQVKEAKEKLENAVSKVKGPETQFRKAEETKKFPKDQLSKFGLIKELKKLNKQLNYYAHPINEYKEILKDAKKIEKKVSRPEEKLISISLSLILFSSLKNTQIGTYVFK